MFKQGLPVIEDAIQNLEKFDALRALQQEPRSVFFKGEPLEEKDEDEEKETIQDFGDDVMIGDIDATTVEDFTTEGLGAEEQDLSGFPRPLGQVLREGQQEASKKEAKKKLRGDAIKKGKEEAKAKKQAMEAKQAEERGESILQFTQKGAEEKSENVLNKEIKKKNKQITQLLQGGGRQDMVKVTQLSREVEALKRDLEKITREM